MVYFYHLLFLSLLIETIKCVILSGSPDSFARFPKWAQTFENQLSFEFRTKSSAALLLYTDDGGVQGNFYTLTIVDGKLQLDFRLGDSNQDVLMERPVHSIRVEQVRVDDGKWHKFVLFQAWENVKIQLDSTVLFKILTQRSFVFGNLRTNSDVFVGGIPSDVHHYGKMSSPLRRHTKRFAGAIKNLIYRLYPQGVSSPQLISSRGTRLTDDDYCALESPCKNSGRCYSTNDGASCDCSFTDFNGRICEKQKTGQSALSFFGHEWIGYDVTNHTSSLIQNRFENISIQFRTAHPNGLLFAAGDKSSYVQLIIERGVLIAASKLFGTEKRIIRMFNKKNQPSRFDDDQWHEVILYRDVELMKLTVDGQMDEVKQFSGDTEWLGNSFAYVGGALPYRSYIPGFTQPFRGCMKKIRYEADAQLMDIIELADQGFGQSVIRTGGDLSFSCESGRLSPAPDVLSFNTGTVSIAMPKWNSPSGGSLGFQFRTGESDSLILFHGLRKPLNQTHSDFLAFEIIDGHLYMVLNLGSGTVRLQATSQRVDDPRVWHSVQLERLGRSGSVLVDNLRTDFSTPGVSANLHLEDPIFIGGIPKEYEAPATVWSAQLKKGFIGCIKNVRINGINAQISKYFTEQADNSSKEEISLGCPSLSGSDYCVTDPCQNGGICRNGHITYHCDCAKTHFEGPRCNDDPAVYSFARRHGDAPRLRLAHQKLSQSEDVEIKFRTEDLRAVLIDTGAFNATDRFRLSLDHGRLELKISIAGSQQSFGWGEGLNDNQWHTVRVNRRGEKLRLFVDGKWENHYILPDGKIDLHIDELNVAEPLQPYEGESEESISNDDFDGDIIKATFNEIDLLEEVRLRQKDRTSSEERSEGQRLKHRKVKSTTVWFDTNEGHLAFSLYRNSTQNGVKLALKFRTLSKKCLIFIIWNEKIIDNELISLQLINGHLRLTRVSGNQLSTSTIKGKRWNDLRWHTIHLSELSNGGLKVSIENKSAEIDGNLAPFRSSGKLFLGGLPTGVPWPIGVTPTEGFRGCMAALKFGNELLDLWSDAESGVQVEKGCRAPSNRCHPDTCKNDGICQQSWTSVKCDCTQTPFSGDLCDQLGTTYDFDGEGSCVYYEYPPNQRPSTSEDSLVLAFQTEKSNGVLFAVQCGVDADFLTVFLSGGYLQVRFSLGTQSHHVHLNENFIQDNHWHVLKLRRQAANLTLQLDKSLPVYYSTKDGLATLNTQWRVSVGAAFNALHSALTTTASQQHPSQLQQLQQQQQRRRRRRHSRVFDEFHGRIAGVNFNGLRVLDAYAHGWDRAFATGRPQLIHMAASEVAAAAIDSGLFSRIEPSGDGFFAAGALDCLSSEARSDCLFDESTTTSTEWDSPKCANHGLRVPAPKFPDRTSRISGGFFSPILPAALTTSPPTPPQAFLEEFTSPIVKVLTSTTTSTTAAATSTVPSTAAPTSITEGFIPATTRIIQEILLESEQQQPSTKALRSTPSTTTPPSPSSSTRPSTHPSTLPSTHPSTLPSTPTSLPMTTSSCPPKMHRTTKPIRIASKGPHALDSLWVDVGTPKPLKISSSTFPTSTIPTFTQTSTRTTRRIFSTIRSSTTSTRRPTTTTTTPRRKTTTTEIPTTTKRFLLNDVTEEPEEGDESGLPHGDAIDRPLYTTSSSSSLHLHYDSYLSPSSSHSTMYTTTEQQPFAVRPTTPMGIIETTLKSADGFRDEIPKTEFVLIASGLTVISVMIILLWLYCCRHQNSSSSDKKPPPSAIAAGYAPIPSETSPREIRSSTTTATVCPVNGSSNGMSHQPVITIATPADTNGIISNGNGIMKKSVNGIGAPLLSEKRRKDFKEWYV